MKTDEGKMNGFSLVEMLVVVAIIGVIASLVTPALGKAKRTARRVVCSGNLKQLTVAWHLYSVESGDKLAPNSSSGPTIIGTTPEDAAWVIGSLNYINDNPDNTNTALLTSKHYGSIAPYNSEPKIYHCPNDASYIDPGGRRSARVRSCSMNAFVGDSPSNCVEGSKYRMFRRMSDLAIVSSALIWLFIDEHEDSIGGGTFWVPCINKGSDASWESIPASRHENGCGLSFADGSVTHKKWTDGRSIIKVARSSQKGIRLPFDQDVIWLQDRTSVLKSEQ